MNNAIVYVKTIASDQSLRIKKSYSVFKTNNSFLSSKNKRSTRAKESLIAPQHPL